MVKFPFKFEDIKPDELRANVMYTGLCHSDSATARSKWDKPKYPICPGHEIIAEVAMIGSAVTKFKIGEKVAFGVVRKSCMSCKMCKKGKETLCTSMERADKATYGNFWGGWATQIQHPAEFFFKLPATLDLQRAAPIVCAGCTVYGPMKNFLKEGDKVAVIGIGGLGHLACQYLDKMGYEVAAWTHSDEKTEDIYNLGCKEVIMIDEPDKIKQNFQRYDFVINTLPTTKYFNDILQLCAPECRYVQVGIPDFDENLKIDFKTWIFNDIILIGSLCGSRKMTYDLLDFTVEKDSYPKIVEYKFEDFPQALDMMENGKPVFRCVVNVEDWSKANGFWKVSNSS